MAAEFAVAWLDYGYNVYKGKTAPTAIVGKADKSPTYQLIKDFGSNQEGMKQTMLDSAYESLQKLEKAGVISKKGLSQQDANIRNWANGVGNTTPTTTVPPLDTSGGLFSGVASAINTGLAVDREKFYNDPNFQRMNSGRTGDDYYGGKIPVASIPRVETSEEEYVQQYLRQNYTVNADWEQKIKDNKMGDYQKDWDNYITQKEGYNSASDIDPYIKQFVKDHTWLDYQEWYNKPEDVPQTESYKSNMDKFQKDKANNKKVLAWLGNHKNISANYNNIGFGAILEDDFYDKVQKSWDSGVSNFTKKIMEGDFIGGIGNMVTTGDAEVVQTIVDKGKEIADDIKGGADDMWDKVMKFLEEAETLAMEGGAVILIICALLLIKDLTYFFTLMVVPVVSYHK